MAIICERLAPGMCFWWCEGVTYFAVDDSRGTTHRCLLCARRAAFHDTNARFHDYFSMDYLMTYYYSWEE